MSRVDPDDLRPGTPNIGDGSSPELEQQHVSRCGRGIRQDIALDAHPGTGGRTTFADALSRGPGHGRKSGRRSLVLRK